VLFYLSSRVGQKVFIFISID